MKRWETDWRNVKARRQQGKGATHERLWLASQLREAGATFEEVPNVALTVEVSGLMSTVLMYPCYTM